MLLQVGRDGEVRLDQDDGRQKRDLELGVGGESQPQVVLGPHHAELASAYERDLLLGTALQQILAHHERRDEVVLLQDIGQLNLTRPIVLQVHLGRRDHAQDLGHVVEDLGEQELVVGHVAAIFTAQAKGLVGDGH